MPALGGAGNGDLDIESGLRIGTGFGLLLAGTVVIAFGVLDLVPGLASGLGVGESTATRIGVVVAGSLAVTVFAAVGSRTAGSEGRRALDAGIGLSMVAVVVGAATASAPATGTLPAIPIFAWVAYGLGILLAFVGALAGEIAPEISTPDSGRSISYTRENRRVTPADGGEDEDDLDFLLDDEE